MPPANKQKSDAVRSEYDFSPGVRGEHHLAYRAGSNVVFLEPDVAQAFPDSASVNRALRRVLRSAKKKTQPPRPTRPRSSQSLR